MALLVLFTAVVAIAVNAAPLQSARRDLSTVISQCDHDFAYTWDDVRTLYVKISIINRDLGSVYLSSRSFNRIQQCQRVYHLL